MKKPKHHTLLGLTFGDKRLNICVVRRSSKGVIFEKGIRVPLSLNPLSAEPELAGREIRNHLDAASIRERNCVVCIPLKWILSLHLSLPDLEEGDREDYIGMQAEKDLPFATDDLQVAISRISLPDTSQHATVAALPKNHLQSLLQVLKSAGIKVLRLEVSIAAVPAKDGESFLRVLCLDSGDWELAAFAGGGIALLRSLGSPGSADEAENQGLASIAQQIRITLGRLPDSLRNSIHEIQLLAPAENLAGWANSLGSLLPSLKISPGASNTNGLMSPQLLQMDPSQWSPGASAAAAYLTGGNPALDFLPPRINHLKNLVRLVSARRSLYLGGGAAACMLIVALVFGTQFFLLKRLEGEWASMEAQVKATEALQDRVREFRPWFDNAAPSLGVLAEITRAFPVAGTVWAKSVEIRDTNRVICAGNARNNAEWLAALQALRKSKSIAALQVTQVKGDNPLQFAMSFQWKESRGNDE